MTPENELISKLSNGCLEDHEASTLVECMGQNPDFAAQMYDDLMIGELISRELNPIRSEAAFLQKLDSLLDGGFDPGDDDGDPDGDDGGDFDPDGDAPSDSPSPDSPTPDPTASSGLSASTMTLTGITLSIVLGVALLINMPSAPLAVDVAEIPVVYGTPVSITLAASDADGNKLTYAIVEPPTKGILSGEAPNLTYRATIGTTGADNFTFKANDGTADSNLATVALRITSKRFELLPAADTYVRGGNHVNTPFGDETSIATKRDRGVATLNTRIAYLRFDLPTMSRLTSAKLRLQVETAGRTAGIQAIRLIADDNWEESTLTHTNSPKPASSDLATFQPKANGIIELNLTEVVRQQLAGDKKLSLYLYATKNTGADGATHFFSKEHEDKTKWPILILEVE